MPENPLKVIYVDNLPEIIRELLPEIKMLIKNCDKEGLFTQIIRLPQITVQSPTNTSGNWWFISNAEVRISPMIGCDRLSLKEPKLIFIEYPIFFNNTHIASVEVYYSFPDRKTEIKNFAKLKAEILDKVCDKCFVLKANCEHNDNLRWQHIVSENILYVDEIKSTLEDDVPNVSKFSELLAGMSKTLKLKTINKLNTLAAEIIRKNPKITEEEMAVELFRRSSELTK